MRLAVVNSPPTLSLLSSTKPTGDHVPVRTCPQCGATYELNQKFCALDGAVLTAAGDDDSLIGKIIAGGRYHVLKQLGEGGMGQVFLAEQVRMDRKCALKVLRPQFASDPRAISRFNREAKNASGIDHPNVARIYEFGDAEHGIIYLAMEYIDGRALSAELKDAPMLEPMRVSEIVRQVADALAAAHELDITHRDLKPDNIMLRRNRNGSETVKVVDFGISKVAGELAQQVTMSGGVVGTPAYMSPEQVSGAVADGRSDIFSLGLVAFKMLTGGLPFVGETGMESMLARLTGRPLRLSDVRRDYDWGPSLDAVMARVLDTNPDNRYATAPEFAQAFQDAVRCIPAIRDADGTTVIFPPTRIPARQRRLLVAGAAVLIGGSLSVGAVWMHGNFAPATRPVPPGAGIAAETAPVSVSAATDAAPQRRAVSGARADGGGGVGQGLRRPEFLLRVVGLPPALRAQIAQVARTMSGVRLVPDTVDHADLTFLAAPNGTTSAVGARGEQLFTRVSAAAFQRTMSQRLRHDVAMQQLAALETPASLGGLSFGFPDDRHSFAIGDEIRFQLRSERGGYLTLLDLAPDGTITILHPSSLIDIGRIAANMPITLPGSSDAVFRANLPSGAGLVRAIVTPAPLLQRRSGDLVTSLEDPMLVEKLRRSLERMGSDSTWSTRAVPYTVRPDAH